MGCEVVSVYNDEIIGKIGYPQPLIDDLIDRDYRQLKPLQKPKDTTNKIQHIYGFTQSFATTRLYFTIVKQIECLVYVAGRFIVKEELKSKRQQIITNPQYITAFSVIDKLCLVGLIGGTLLLWDLEFLQTKLQVLLPEESTTISTVGFTHKYIFATDSSTPNNIAYCYDLRTGMLLSGKPIPSLEPAVRSISISQNLHVTACADGIWILKMEKRENEMQVIKGMFGRFPKTSICSLAKIGQYLLGGGVDGYVYVWKINTLRCCKALKVSDSEIVSIGIKDKYIIFGCLGGRVKVYTFQVRKKEKKEYVLDEGENEDEEQDFAFIVVDSYSKEGSTVAIATSILVPYLYCCMTRQGLLYEKYLPAPTSDRKKIGLQSKSETILRVNTSGTVTLSQSKIYSTYRVDKSLIMVDVYSMDQESLVLEEQRTALLGQSSQNILAYSPIFEEIVYLTSNNKIVASVTFNKVVQSVSHENKSDIGSNTQQICTIQHEKVLSINFVSKGSLLCVTSNQSIWIYRRTARINYQQIDHIKYQKNIPSSIKVDQQQLVYEQQCQSWRLRSEDHRSISPQEISHYQLVHASMPKSLEKNWLQMKATAGGGFIILWK